MKSPTPERIWLVTEKLRCHCQWRRRPRRKMHLLPSSTVYRFGTASRLTNMQDLNGDASPTACQETGRNRTFPVPRTWKAGALTASTDYIHIRLHTLLKYVLTFAFQFLCSFSAFTFLWTPFLPFLLFSSVGIAPLPFLFCSWGILFSCSPSLCLSAQLLSSCARNRTLSVSKISKRRNSVRDCA